MKRGAVTLVEAIFALAIASIILTVLWQTFGAAQRDALAADRRLQAVTAFQRLSQALEADLTRLIAVDEAAISIGERGQKLEFDAVETDPEPSGGQGALIYRKCTYRFRADDHTVLRSSRQPAGALEPLPGVRLKELVFTRSNVSYDRAAIRVGPLPPADSLLAEAVWVPLEDLVAGRPTPEKDTVTMTLPFTLQRLSDTLRYPFWITNPTSKARSAAP